MGSYISARTMSGGLFALRTGATWMLLLPADNWDMMVFVYSTYILYMLMFFSITPGGYTQGTSSSSPERIMSVDPVEYHCSGQESDLQTCDNLTNSRCSDRDVATIVCVQRNVSGTHIHKNKARARMYEYVMYCDYYFRSMQQWGYSPVGWRDRV